MIDAGIGPGRLAIGPIRLLGRRSGRLALAFAAALVGPISLRTAQATVGFSYLADSIATAIVGLAAGWGLVAVGLETRRRGRRPLCGGLLIAAGIAWFLPEWSEPAIGSSIGFSIGLSLGWLAPAIVGHALFTVASGPGRSGVIRAIVVAGYALLVVGLGIVPALGFDPRAAGCGFCPANVLDIAGSTGWADGATRVAAALSVVWVGIAITSLVHHLVIAGPSTRIERLALVVPGIVFLLLVGIVLARTAVLDLSPTDRTDHLLRLGEAVALLAVAAGVGWEWVRARRARGRVARLVADLAQSPPIGGLRDHLATILGDPGLMLAYRLAGGGAVDAAGRPVNVEPRPGWRTTPILRDGQIVALIEHSQDVLRDPGQIDEVVAAARLGLEHERLQAEARTQLETLRLARRRIVEAGDAHRKRLERDLHDGAQQHLIALSIALHLLEREGGPPLLDDAAAEVGLALDDLRDVAHGLYPTVLSDEGLAAAIDGLAESAAVPMTIGELVDERYAPSIEVAAYHVVVASVHSGAGPVDVEVRRTADQLRVQVVLPSIADDVVEDMADRVAAVDGILTVARDAGSTTIVAEIPCAS